MLIRRLTVWLLLTLAIAMAGCGTSAVGYRRTATEQMLMSDAIDRSISQIDFSALTGRDVYLDGKYIAGLVDEKYVMSTLRQHLFASGCIVKDKIDDATYVVEVAPARWAPIATICCWAFRQRICPLAAKCCRSCRPAFLSSR